jgi:hypothetical protein
MVQDIPYEVSMRKKKDSKLNLKDKRLNINETREYLEELSAVSSIVRKTMSDFVREAIDEKKERLAKRNPRVAEIVNRNQVAA